MTRQEIAAEILDLASELLVRGRSLPETIREDQKMVADLGVHPQSYGDFIDEFEFRLGVKAPGEAERQAGKGFLGRIMVRANPLYVANPPDLTLGELIAIAEGGLWPEEHLQATGA
jgi:hypothetical protein